MPKIGSLTINTTWISQLTRSSVWDHLAIPPQQNRKLHQNHQEMVSRKKSKQSSHKSMLAGKTFSQKNITFLKVLGAA